MVSVVKASGEKEPFSEEKVKNSIHRAGISQELQAHVLSHVKEKLYDNIKTSEIYHHIIEFLGNSLSPYSKTSYGLKQAIMAFGPTGYPFEDFVAKLLDAHGYKTSVRNSMQGKCVVHEVDVVAIKEVKKVMIEVKFHNQPGIKTNIHVALYTKARFNDLLERNGLNEAWIVTNTKITSDAIAYAVCMGMKVISWNYPEGESLRDMIEKSGLTPVTALTTLPKSNLDNLLSSGVVLCRDLHKQPKLLSGMSEDKKQTILQEAEFVCQI